jgi:hypothetical protein
MGVEAKDVKFRLYRPEDQALIFDFWCADEYPWTQEAQDELRRQALLKTTEDDDETVIVVAHDLQDRLVGVIAAGFGEEQEYMVFSLGVALDRRRQYIGLRLKQMTLVELSIRAGRPLTVYSLVHEQNAAMNGLNKVLEGLSDTSEDHPEHFIWGVKVAVED